MRDYFIKQLPSIRGALGALKPDDEIEADSVKQF